MTLLTTKRQCRQRGEKKNPFWSRHGWSSEDPQLSYLFLAFKTDLGVSLGPHFIDLPKWVGSVAKWVAFHDLPDCIWHVIQEKVPPPLSCCCVSESKRNGSLLGSKSLCKFTERPGRVKETERKTDRHAHTHGEGERERERCYWYVELSLDGVLNERKRTGQIAWFGGLPSGPQGLRCM